MGSVKDEIIEVKATEPQEPLISLNRILYIDSIAFGSKTEAK